MRDSTQPTDSSSHAAGDPPARPLLGSGRLHDSLQEGTVEQLLAERTAILGQIADGVIITDADGAITFINEAARRLHGVAELGVPVEAYSQTYHLHTLEGEPYPPEMLPLSRAVLRGETVGDARWRIRRPDGAEIAVQGSASPVIGEAGRQIGAVLVLRDITTQLEIERQRDLALAEAERDRERLEQVIQALPVGLILADANGTIVTRNRAAMELLPHLGESIGAHLGEIDRVQRPDGSSYTANNLPLSRSLLGGETVRSEEIRVTGSQPPDGTGIPLLVNSAPLRDAEGKINGGVAVYQDVTRLKRVEMELRQANEAKEDFLALLAHELRNPLAPILNALQVLNLASPDDPSWKRARSAIERQVSHMARLLDDLLDVSRIKRGRVQLRLEDVELGTIVERSIQSSASAIESRGHRLEVSLWPSPLLVRADPVRLEQVLCNLLRNASKYTEPGGEISVTVTEAAGEAIVEVRDSGIGIPPAQLSRIFDLFMQIDPTLDRSQGGLGIGLTLVQTLVQMHSGRVTAQSAGPGQGSRFTIWLPLLREKPSDISSAVPEAGHQEFASGRMGLDPVPAPAASPMNGRILLIEDNPDGRETLRDLLLIWGYAVDVAEDGSTGIRKALELYPDTVLVDIGLPGVDGYQVARELRARMGNRSVLLIALTGYSQPEDRRRALEAGFDEHLVKPVNLEHLSQILTSR